MQQFVTVQMTYHQQHISYSFTWRDFSFLGEEVEVGLSPVLGSTARLPKDEGMAVNVASAAWFAWPDGGLGREHMAVVVIAAPLLGAG